MTTIRRTLAAFAIAALFAAPAHAEPAQIDDGSGPLDVGAHIEDGSGTVGYDFTQPVTIPEVGPAPVKPAPDATPQEIADYKTAVREHDAQVQARMQAQGSEHARKAALAYRQCIAAGEELC